MTAEHMTAAATDLPQPAQYSRDRQTIDRLPIAIFLCFLGLALLIYGDPPRPGQLKFIALAFLALIVVAACASFLLTYALHWMSPVAGLGLVLVVVAAIIMTFGIPSRRSPSGPNETALAGWLCVTIGVTWLTFVVTRLFFPARPWLAFSRDGITYRHGGSAEMVIPWHEVEAITSRFELDSPHAYWDVTTILISQDFYDRIILPKYTVLQAPGWDTTFRAKGPQMQMALNHHHFLVDAKDIHEPLQAWWTASRDQPRPSVPSVRSAPVAKPADAPHVYGRWSGHLTRWQAVKFALPAIGLLAVVTNATGLWDTAFLRGMREDRAAKLKRYEDAAAEQIRYRDMMRQSNEAARERERESREREREMNRIFSR